MHCAFVDRFHLGCPPCFLDARPCLSGAALFLANHVIDESQLVEGQLSEQEHVTNKHVCIWLERSITRAMLDLLVGYLLLS